MLPSQTVSSESLHHWIVVRQELAGQFTAQLLGLPELSATAASREEAIEQVHVLLEQWLDSGRLTPLVLHPAHALRSWPGHDPADPLEQEFVADLERSRQEDLERATRQNQP
jgi:hypothetical protein